MEEARENPAPLCFVVDDEPAVGRFVALAARQFNARVEQFLDLGSLLDALADRQPQLIFLSTAVCASDYADALRRVRTSYRGFVQLLIPDARTAIAASLTSAEGEAGLMNPLCKPIRIDQAVDVFQAAGIPRATTILPLGRRSAREAAHQNELPRIDLGQALAHGWVELWYQPKVDLHAPLLAGAEGLARVNHPEFGILPPSTFLPHANGIDLVALADFTLRTALRDGDDFAAIGHALPLSLNFPFEALVRLPVTSIVREATRSDEGIRQNLILEVTEDQLLQDMEAAQQVATQLRAHGIGLSLDDFRTGYSSLGRLRGFPFSELKLDRSYVIGCGLDPANAALCRSAVDLAHRFGCLAVAEGVETVDDLATIRRVGCDLAQGYLFAHPMPKEMLLARLRANGGGGGFTARLAANVGDDFRAIA